MCSSLPNRQQDPLPSPWTWKQGLLEASVGSTPSAAPWEEWEGVSRCSMGRGRSLWPSRCLAPSFQLHAMVLSPTRTKGTRVRAHINQSTFNRMWWREAASPKSQTGGLLAALVFGFVELGFFFWGERIVGAAKSPFQKCPRGSLLQAEQTAGSTGYLRQKGRVRTFCSELALQVGLDWGPPAVR